MLNSSNNPKGPSCVCGSVDLYEEMLKQKQHQSEEQDANTLDFKKDQPIDLLVDTNKSKHVTSKIIQNINEK